MKRICSLLLAVLVLFSALPVVSAASGTVVVLESITMIESGKYNDSAIKNIVILNPNCDIRFTDYSSWYEIFFGEFAWQGSLQMCDLTLGEAVVHSPMFDGIVTAVEKRVLDHDCAYHSMYDNPPHSNEFHGCTYIDNADGTTDLYCPICDSVQATNVVKMTADGENVGTQDPAIIGGSNWKLNKTSGILYVSGTGKMYDYYYGNTNRPPWWNYRTYIKEIVVAEGLTSIGWNAFYDCTNVEKVTLPDTVTCIYNSAFSKCSSLTSINLPKNLQYICQYAFDRCTSLTSITIPASVEEIDQSFRACTSLREVIFEADVLVWKDAFESSSNIEIVRVSKTEDWFNSIFMRILDDYFVPGMGIDGEIPTYTSNPLYYGADFYVGTEKITRLEVPQSVETVRPALFYNCGSITEVVLPRSVSEIGAYSFACPNLTDVVITNPQCKLDTSAFSGTSSVTHALSGSTAEAFAKQMKKEFHPCVYISNGDDTHDFYCTVCMNSKIKDEPHEHEENHPCICGYTVPCEHVCQSEILQQPTCTEEGQLRIFCILCGYSSVSVIAATGHTYAVDTIAPTCTAKGYTSYFCACGDGYTADYVDAMGHDWSPWTTDGVRKHRICRTCGVTEEAVEENLFTDVDETDYFYAPVIWAVIEGITNGMGETEFAPNEPCTRGQIVTFLWRSQGSPMPQTTETPFVDVPKQAYYYHAVLWAVENGITNGLSATEFAPDVVCTRAQAVTLLYRTCGSVSMSENQFIDVAPTDYFYEPVLWAVENGITMGVGGGRFAPQSNCTRAQIVTFLYRALS